MEKGWQAVEMTYGLGLAFTSLKSFPREPSEIHVKPLDDIVMHVLVGLECPCGVVRQDSGIYVHNSWDGRDNDETELEVKTY